MSKPPAVLGLPTQERKQPVAEQVLRCLGWLAPFQIGRTRHQLMPVGQDPARDERRILQLPDPECQVNAVGDVIDEPFGG
jgi:hypothetical protein